MKTNTLQLKTIMITLIIVFCTITTEKLFAQSQCNFIAFVGTVVSPSIIQDWESQIVGVELRLNRRKTLIVRDIESLQFDGCRVTAVARITIRRKFRRDAHGTVTVVGDASRSDLSMSRICIDNWKYKDISLSHTSLIGELFYKKFSEKILVVFGRCFSTNRNASRSVSINTIQSNLKTNIGAQNNPISEVQGYDFSNNIVISPNPVNDVLTITSKETINNIRLYNLQGQKILEKNNRQEVYMSDIPKGIYLLQLESKTGIATKRIIKN